MNIQEALENVTEGEILFSGLKTSYMEANIQKDGKIEIYASEHTHRHPEHDP